MDLHAAFKDEIDGDAGVVGDGSVQPINKSASELYASLVNREQNVLDLVRRVDDTKRAEALRHADRVAPLVNAFLAGFSGFLTRFLHYLSSGATNELIGLVTSPDGMVYAGVLVAACGIVIMMIA